MKIGDKVVCIDDKDINDNSLKEGKIYTITKIYNIFNQVVVELKFYDSPYLIDRFRKLITDHTFSNSTTKELAGKPLIKERIEKIEPEKAECLKEKI